jgi:hypothetical protein
MAVRAPPQEHSVKVLDYARSSLIFRIDTLVKPPITASHKPPFSLNNARILLESTCWITDERDGRTRRFVHGASCKTERVGVKRDIWMQPNADFIPIASEERILVLKTYARQGDAIPLWPEGRGMQNERQEVSLADAYSGFSVDLTEAEAEPLPDARAIVNAVLAGDRLVARTTLKEGPYSAVIEYPVKTINANERDWIYQTDTGPHLLPDLSRGADDLLGGMELAFSAFNVPEWIEFIVRAPTNVTEDILVWHYSRSVRRDVLNEMFRIA